MPIYTTYVGNRLKFLKAQKLGSCFIYYVARNRGNNEVAPAKEMVEKAAYYKRVREGKQRWPREHFKPQPAVADVFWNKYVWQYLRILEEDDAIEWMEKRAGEAKIGNILLVCYEKDATHCHRRLLAEEIARRFGVEYKGELV